MSDYNKIMEEIFASIHLITDRKINELKKEQTITAKITSVLDTSTNKYEISYKNMSYEAYSLKDDEYYVDDSVIVLIPDGDFSAKKVILTRADKSAELLLGGSSTSSDPSRSGFENSEDSIIFLDDNLFVIQSKERESYNIYISGVRYEKTYDSIDFSTLPSGVYRIFFDKITQEIGYQTTDFTISSQIPIAYLCWDLNATNGVSKVFLIDERHTIAITESARSQLHSSGTIYKQGFELSYALSTLNTVSIQEGKFNDEDLSVYISNGSLEDYTQTLQPTLYAPILYLKGTSSNPYWVSKGTTITDLLYTTVSGVPQYNNLSNSLSYTNSNVASSQEQTNGTAKYFATYLVASNAPEYPIFGIEGQTVDISLSDANKNNKWSLLTKAGLPTEDLRPLYKLIFKYIYQNSTHKVTLEQVVDLRTSTDNTVALLESFTDIKTNQYYLKPSVGSIIKYATYDNSLNSYTVSNFDPTSVQINLYDPDGNGFAAGSYNIYFDSINKSADSQVVISTDLKSLTITPTPGTPSNPASNSNLKSIKVDALDSSQKIIASIEIPTLYIPAFISGWDGTKTKIGDTYILTPQFFAGTMTNNKPTGVAIGKDVVSGGVTGMVAYDSSTGTALKTFELTTAGNLTIGKSGGNQLSYTSSTGVLSLTSGGSTNSTISIKNSSDVEKIVFSSTGLTMGGNSQSFSGATITLSPSTIDPFDVTVSNISGNSTAIVNSFITISGSSVFNGNWYVKSSSSTGFTFTMNTTIGLGTSYFSQSLTVTGPAFSYNTNTGKLLITGGIVSHSIAPEYDDRYSMGYSNYRFRYIYGTYFIGDGSKLTNVVAKFG